MGQVTKQVLSKLLTMCLGAQVVMQKKIIRSIMVDGCHFKFPAYCSVSVGFGRRMCLLRIFKIKEFAS